MRRSLLGGFVEGGGEVENKKIMSGIEVVSQRQLKIRLKKPYPPFLKILAYSLYGIVRLDSTLENVVSTSGPMQIAEAKDSIIRLERTKENNLHDVCIPLRIELSKNIESTYIKKWLDEKIYDLAFGYSDVTTGSSANAIATSIAYSHLFLNKNRSDFHNEPFRKSFIDQIWQAFDKNLSAFGYYKKWSHFMPPLVMSQEYYFGEHPSVVSPLAFKKKWCKRSCSQKYLIVLLTIEESRLNMDGIKKHFQEAGLTNIEIQFVDSKKWFEILKGGRFDLIEATYLGTYSDPDSYLSPLIGDNAVETLYSGNLKNEIEGIRFGKSETERKKLYLQALKKFEEDRYFVPIQYKPMLMYTRAGVFLPNARFKYDLRVDVQIESGK